MQRYHHTHVHGKDQYVHRIRMERKLGRRLRRTELVHHRNHNRRDDRGVNLQVVTAKQHSVLHHIAERFSGEHSPKAKLTDRLVRCIRRSPLSCRMLARELGVHFSLISRVRLRERWKYT